MTQSFHVQRIRLFVVVGAIFLPLCLCSIQCFVQILKIAIPSLFIVPSTSVTLESAVLNLPKSTTSTIDIGALDSANNNRHTFENLTACDKDDPCFAAVKDMTIHKNNSQLVPRTVQRHRKDIQVKNRFGIRHCPPKGFDAMKNFDLESYVSARWYVQRYKTVNYSRDKSFCSYAQYTIIKKKPFCAGLLCERGKSLQIKVVNRGLIGGVTGRENIARLKATVPNPIKDPAKIQVALQVPGRTNYWIVAAGTYAVALDGSYSQHTVSISNATEKPVYEWALISGGSPNVRTRRGKCVAGLFGQYDVRGFWLFARDRVPPEGVLSAVTEIAEGMGLDTKVWRNVTQEGCT